MFKFVHLIYPTHFPPNDPNLSFFAMGEHLLPVLSRLTFGFPDYCGKWPLSPIVQVSSRPQPPAPKPSRSPWDFSLVTEGLSLRVRRLLTCRVLAATPRPLIIQAQGCRDNTYQQLTYSGGSIVPTPSSAHPIILN